MGDTMIDHDQARRELFDPLKPKMSVRVALQHTDTRHHADALAAELVEAHPQDTVLRLHVGDMLADRRGPGRGLLARLLLTRETPRGEANREAFLKRLRGLIPEGLQPLSWLLNATALSPAGADAVGRALAVGDFAAAQTMMAHTHHQVLREESEWVEHIHSERPLTESDIRILIDRVMREPTGDRVRWLIFSGLEHIGGASPHTSGFRKALREFLLLARSWPNTVVVFACWSAALESLERFDPALARIARETSGGAALSPPLLMNPPVQRVLLGLQMRFQVSFQARPDLAAWIGLSEQGGVALIWPTEDRDPAARAVLSAVRVVEIVIGLPMAILVPEWALGQLRAQDRTSMRAARPHLGWVPLRQEHLGALAGAPPEDPTLRCET